MADRIQELEMLVADLREVLEERDAFVGQQTKEIEVLRYNLHRCRENAYQAWQATAGILPDGYGPSVEAAEAPKKRGKK